MVGRTVGRYRIIAGVGHGEGGSVWKAEDPLLRRIVALKLFPADATTVPGSQHPLLREAQAAAVLHHPGIATIFDVGEADGLAFIAYQFIDGESLRDCLARGPLPVQEAVRVAMAAGEALAHAHRNDIFHRDLASRNIVLGRDGRVVVVGFGLAPQVLLGHQVDQTSDLHSLGVVLHEMLVGEWPPAGDSADQSPHAGPPRPPEPPSRRPPEIRGKLDRIVLRALATNPGERYQSAEAMVADLRALTGVTDRGPGSRPPAAARIVRTLALPAFLVAILIAALWWALRSPPAGHAPSMQFATVAVLPFDSVGEDSEAQGYLADGMSQSLVAKLTQIAGLHVTPWMTAARYRDAPLPPDRIASELGVEAIVTGEVSWEAGTIHCAVTVTDRATGETVWEEEFAEPGGDLFGVQRRLARSVAIELHGRLTETEERDLARPAARDVTAYTNYLRGAAALAEEAAEGSDRALALFQKALEGDPDLADAYVGIGAVLTERYYEGRGADERSLLEAEANFRKALALDPTKARARAGLIRIHWQHGRLEDCLREGREARRAGPDDIENQLAAAQAYVLCSLLDKAIPILQEIRARDPANLGAHFFLALAFSWSFPSRDHGREALDLWQDYLRKFGEDGEARRWVADAYEGLGELEKARIEYERIRDDNGELTPLSQLSRVYRRLGRADRARELMREEVEIVTRRLRDSPQNHAQRCRLAVIYARLHDRRGFYREFEKVPKASRINNGCSELAIVLAEVGDIEGALNQLRLQLSAGQNFYFELHLREDQPGFDPIRNDPAFAEVMRDLEALDRRLHAEY